MTKKSSEPTKEDKHTSLPDSAQLSKPESVDIPRKSGFAKDHKNGETIEHNHDAPKHNANENNYQSDFLGNNNGSVASRVILSFKPTTLGFILVYIFFAILSISIIVVF